MDKIDVALTFDVERDASIKSVMPKIADLFGRYDANGTWFLKHDYTNRFTDYTGRVIEDYPEIVEELSEVGEIGTHIHFRDMDGTFSMDPKLQRKLLECATETFRSRGFSARSFRGGNLCVDATTLNILDELEYMVDSSVLPGHYRELPDGVVVDHRGETGNRPYYPAKNCHVSYGNLNLLEVPVSGLLPFEGLSRGRSLRGLYNRTIRTESVNRILPVLFQVWGWTSGAPVVLLFHDHEFSPHNGSLSAFDRFLRYLSESKWFRLKTISQIAEEWY